MGLLTELETFSLQWWWGVEEQSEMDRKNEYCLDLDTQVKRSVCLKSLIASRSQLEEELGYMHPVVESVAFRLTKRLFFNSTNRLKYLYIFHGVWYRTLLTKTLKSVNFSWGLVEKACYKDFTVKFT